MTPLLLPCKHEASIALSISIKNTAKTRRYATTKIWFSKCPEDQFQLTLFSRYVQPFPSTTGWKYPIKEWKVAWVANAWDIKRNIPWVATGRVQAAPALAVGDPFTCLLLRSLSHNMHLLPHQLLLIYSPTSPLTYLPTYVSRSKCKARKALSVRDPLSCAQALWQNILL